jgi:hypothetical protein
MPIRKTYRAIVAALEEATQTINKDSARRPSFTRRWANDKSPVEELYKLLAHPEMDFTTVPNSIMKYVDFHESDRPDQGARGVLERAVLSGRSTTSPGS